MYSVQSFKKKFWLYVIAIISPIIIIGCVAAIILFEKLAIDTEKLNLRVVHQMESFIENQLMDMVVLSQRVGNNSVISEYLNNNSEYNFTNIDVIKISGELSGYLKENDFKKFGIYFQKSNILVDNVSRYSFDEYYEKYLSNSKYDYDFWSGKFKDGDIRTFFAESSYIDENQNEKETLIICGPVRFFPKGRVAMFVAQVEQAWIESMILDQETSGIEGFAVLDDNKTPVFAAGNFEEKILEKLSLSDLRSNKYQNGKYTLLIHKSNNFNLNYISVYSVNGMTGNVRSVLFSFLLILFIGFLICMLLAKNVEFKFRKPVEKAIAENYNLNKVLDAQIEFEQERVLKDMLYNMGNTRTSINVLSKEFERSIYTIMVLKTPDLDWVLSENDNEQNANILKTTKEIIEDKLSSIGIIHKCITVDKKMVFVLGYENDVEISKVVNNIYSEIYGKIKIYVILAVGAEVRKLNRIWYSYDTALYTLRKSRNEFGKVFFYTDISKDSNDCSIFYTKEKELSLVKNIKSNDTGKVNQILDELYQVNFIERTLSESRLKRLIAEITHTLYALIDDVYEEETEENEKLTRVAFQILQNKTAEDSFYILRELCLSLCVEEENRKENDELRIKIIEVVEQNYMNPDFSLSYLADYLNISYYYLSVLFKEKMGCKFVFYLMNVRMENAKKLLEERIAVKNVASMVGFRDSNTFIRAYKKFYNETPGEYAKKLE